MNSVVSLNGVSSLDGVPLLPSGPPSVLVIIPTYDEAANLYPIVQGVLRACDGADVLVVDDNSPDGTGRFAEQLEKANPRIHVLHRRGPRGLGAAYMAGFRWALRRPYTHVVQMDADFSHDPTDIPRLLEQADTADVVIGSRYCRGGRTEGWPRKLRRLSFAANCYASLLLNSRVRDLTSGFRCWRREILERIDFALLRCNGYAFQVEMAHLAHLAGARIREIPIIFHERRNAVSRMTVDVVREAARHTAQLGWERCTGQKHPALLPVKEEARQSANDPERGKGSSPRNVLVMCLGGIGDSVMSFAMLRQLRQRLPHARLTALAMWPQAADLIRDLGVFDEVLQHNFQTDRWWRSLAWLARLHFRRFDMSILAYPANRWEYNLASWIIHAGRRVGHSYLNGGGHGSLDWLLTDMVAQTPRTHNIDENLKLLSKVPAERSLERPMPPDISLGPLAPVFHEYAERVLVDIAGPYLGIHAGSSVAKNMSAKRWPAERFAELCRMAHEQLGLTPLLFGSQAEAEANKLIAAACPAARIMITPSIRHTAAIMQRCSVFVSNDSALAHIAAALDVPVVAVMGPTDPKTFGPYGKHGVAVTAGMACSPCYRPCRASLECRGNGPFECMSKVLPLVVLQQVKQVSWRRKSMSVELNKGQTVLAAGLALTWGDPPHQGINA